MRLFLALGRRMRIADAGHTAMMSSRRQRQRFLTAGELGEASSSWRRVARGSAPPEPRVYFAAVRAVLMADWRESEAIMTSVQAEHSPPSTTRLAPATSLAPNLARTIVVVVFSSFALIAFMRILLQGFGPPSRIIMSL